MMGSVFSLEALRSARLILLLALTTAPLLAERWEMQYFYDQSKSVLGIADIQFPSPTRGIAVGVIHEGSRQKPVSITTVDGGATWSQSPLDDDPISLFFLNDSQGWMVTEKGIWRTT